MAYQTNATDQRTSPQQPVLESELHLPWTPRSKYDVADLGCREDAPLIYRLSRENPEWVLLGIDPAVPRTQRSGRIDFIKAKAEEAIPALSDHSLYEVYAFYFLNNLPRETAAEVIVALKSKLHSTGRVHVGHRREEIGDVAKLCQECGYQTSEPRLMNQDEIGASTYAQCDVETVSGIKSLSEGDAFMINTSHSIGTLFEYMGRPHLFEPMVFVATLNSNSTG